MTRVEEHQSPAIRTHAERGATASLIRRHPLLLSLLAGVLSAIGFAPINFWPATLAGLVLFLHLVRRARNMKQALLMGWLYGVGNFSVGLNWLAHAFSFQDAMPHWFGYGAVLLLASHMAVYSAITAGIAWRWGRGVAYVLLFASAWIFTEWLRATLLTGFAWNPLGVVTISTPAAFWAPLFGTYGLSGMIVLAAGSILLAVEHCFSRSAEARVRAFAVFSAWLCTIAAALCLPFAISLSGALNGIKQSSSRPRVRVVQPNIPQQEKHDRAFSAVNFAKLARLTRLGDSSASLIFWPESAIPEYLDEQPQIRARLSRLIRPGNILITGGLASVKDEAGSEIAARNSIFMIDSRAHVLGRYDKAHLVPFGEYLPMRPMLSAIGLSRLVPGALDFWPGRGPVTFNLPGIGRMGAQICYEIIFSGNIVDPAHRPDFIFNPSNDAWFGRWGPPQHLAQARLRAIEEGIPIIRSTETGISAVIDADGRILYSLPLNSAGFIDARLPTAHVPTPFARFGNILPLGLAIFLASVAAVLRSRSQLGRSAIAEYHRLNSRASGDRR